MNDWNTLAESAKWLSENIGRQWTENEVLNAGSNGLIEIFTNAAAGVGIAGTRVNNLKGRRFKLRRTDHNVLPGDDRVALETELVPVHPEILFSLSVSSDRVINTTISGDEKFWVMATNGAQLATFNINRESLRVAAPDLRSFASEASNFSGKFVLADSCENKNADGDDLKSKLWALADEIAEKNRRNNTPVTSNEVCKHLQKAAVREANKDLLWGQKGWRTKSSLQVDGRLKGWKDPILRK